MHSLECISLGKLCNVICTKKWCWCKHCKPTVLQHEASRFIYDKLNIKLGIHKTTNDVIACISIVLPAHFWMYFEFLSSWRSVRALGQHFCWLVLHVWKPKLKPAVKGLQLVPWLLKRLKWIFRINLDTKHSIPQCVVHPLCELSAEHSLGQIVYGFGALAVPHHLTQVFRIGGFCSLPPHCL